MARILYFLEDRAQERFIKALVERVASDASVSASSLHHDVRSARGGSVVIPEFKKFMKDTRQTPPSDVDLLVVAIDGNCLGYNSRVGQLKRAAGPNHPLQLSTVYAVPNPHIERWYIMDQRAFKLGVGVDRAPDMPPYKCDKNYYKNIIRQSLAESNVSSLLGGAEYGESIVSHITRLDALFAADEGFRHFVEESRRFLRRI